MSLLNFVDPKESGGWLVCGPDFDQYDAMDIYSEILVGNQIEGHTFTVKDFTFADECERRRIKVSKYHPNRNSFIKHAEVRAIAKVANSEFLVWACRDAAVDHVLLFVGPEFTEQEDEILVPIVRATLTDAGELDEADEPQQLVAEGTSESVLQ